MSDQLTLDNLSELLERTWSDGRERYVLVIGDPCELRSLTAVQVNKCDDGS